MAACASTTLISASYQDGKSTSASSSRVDRRNSRCASSTRPRWASTKAQIAITRATQGLGCEPESLDLRSGATRQSRARVPVALLDHRQGELRQAEDLDQGRPDRAPAGAFVEPRSRALVVAAEVCRNAAKEAALREPRGFLGQRLGGARSVLVHSEDAVAGQRRSDQGKAAREDPLLAERPAPSSAFSPIRSQCSPRAPSPFASATWAAARHSAGEVAICSSAKRSSQLRTVARWPRLR